MATCSVYQKLIVCRNTYKHLTERNLLFTFRRENKTVPSIVSTCVQQVEARGNKKNFTSVIRFLFERRFLPSVFSNLDNNSGCKQII